MLLALALTALAAEVADATGPVTVDGRLDEATWAAAVPVTDFTRFQPVEGGPPAGTTEVRFLQDDRFLYVGVKVTGVAAPVRARMSQRELINADDQIGLYLDTFHDGRTGYIFYTNALGIQQDIRHNNGRWNVDWDTAYRSKGTVTDDGFELELAFPWRSLRYPGEAEQTWGLLITRKIPGEGAKYGYPDLERGHPRLFQQGAPLTGVKPGSRGTGLELMPSLTGAVQAPRDEAPAPLEVVRPSLDARYAITPDLGAAATLNPDFSQVESDIRDVRLNARFAYQFPERRPFFLDGIDAFQDRMNTLYTRSIDQPLYGVKISGRDEGVSVGAVHALDRTPLASFHERSAPGFGADDVAGRFASNTMARVQLDAFGAGYVGVSFADKRLVDTPASGGSAPAHFDLGGADVVVPLGDRWIAGGSTAHSVVGSPGGEVLWGQQNEASLARASGIGTGASLSVLDRTDGFRNEVGFVTQSALTDVNASLDHTFTPGTIVDTVVPVATGRVLQERNDTRDRYAEATGGVAVLVDGIHTFGLIGGATQVRELEVEADGGYAQLAYGGQVGALLEWYPTLRLARGFDYALGVPANDQSASLDATVRAGGMRLDATTRVDRHVPIGAAAQRATFARGRLGYQFTRTLGLRLVAEHTSGTELDYDALRSSILFTWLDVPGTAVYVGVTEDDAIDGGLRLVERLVFAKVSVLLRP